jgi:hypothetical protein
MNGYWIVQRRPAVFRLSLGLLLAWLVSGCSTLLPVVDNDQARGQAVLALTAEADQAYYRRDWEQAEMPSSLTSA